MFLIEPLIWMFKVKDFGKHVLKQFLLVLSVWFILGILFFITPSLLSDLSFESEIVRKIVALILLILPFLSITGYFWCLTDEIINREQDTVAKDVYNGRVGLKDKITLPEWSIKKFVWRGFASLIATIIMYIPIVMIVTLMLINIDKLTGFWNMSQDAAELYLLGIICFICFFIPALLWNYARRDSVIAVLNFPKAVYIVENYTGKYILNTVLFIILSLVHSFIIKSIALWLGLGMDMTSHSITFTSASNVLLQLIVYLILCFVVELYFLYVNAYLLGTIAPPCEA